METFRFYGMKHHSHLISLVKGKVLNAFYPRKYQLWSITLPFKYSFDRTKLWLWLIIWFYFISYLFRLKIGSKNRISCVTIKIQRTLFDSLQNSMKYFCIERVSKLINVTTTSLNFVFLVKPYRCLIIFIASNQWARQL